jgi:methionyl-tRNA synthetase
LKNVISLYPSVGKLIEQGDLKEALDVIFGFIRSANKYFDEEQPWITVKNNIEKCKETLNTCVHVIANLSLLLDPFLPLSSAKVRNILNIRQTAWQYITVPAGLELRDVEILFIRIDRKVIALEEAKIGLYS